MQHYRRYANEVIILSKIRKAKSGITQKDLISETNLKRDTVGRVCDRLKQKRIITHRKKGKYVIYKIKDSITDYQIEAILYSNQIKSNFFNPTHLWNVDINLLNFGKNANKINEEHVKLFEFSNGIGSLVTHVMLTGFSLLANHKDYQKLNKKQRSVIIQQWLQPTLEMVLEPMDLITKFILWFPDYNNTSKKSFFDYDKKYLKKLKNEFAELYPSISQNLDKIVKEFTPEKIERVRKNIEKYHKSIDCIHEFEIKKLKKSSERFCKKCDFSEKIENS